MPGLFVTGPVVLHSGSTGGWKVDCDALSDDDLRTVAAMLVERLPPFGEVEGVPRGGLRLAGFLREHRSSGPLLIVDDVCTTGASLEEHRVDRAYVVGAVIFARGSVPSWVTPLWRITEVP